MIFTIFYAYATLMQWYKLRCLKTKLNGTLNAQNALIVCTKEVANESRKNRSLENLLFHNESSVACTILPKQKLNLNQWIAFPKNLNSFPIYLKKRAENKSTNDIYILIQAVLDNYTNHDADLIQVENFGDLIGWKATDNFEVVVKTNIDDLTKLVNRFSQRIVDINHDLQLLRLETVDVEGCPAKIKYDKVYREEETVKYSYAPAQWAKFVADIKQLSAKIHDVTNPKIKIENGTASVPIEQKKSETKRAPIDDKNTLDVSDGRRHKKNIEQAQAGNKQSKKTADETKLKIKTTTADNSSKLKSTKKIESNPVLKSEIKEKRKLYSKTGSYSAKTTTRKMASTGKMVANSIKMADDVDSAPNSKNPTEGKVALNGGDGGNFVKPPNILVFADSLITKENVKRVLQSIINKNKYTIYDFPTDSKCPSWISSTILVVVCGAVPPDLTPQIIDYFLNGGQMLCLCSDLMYTILHTFTTAEVREHELVRFSYGTWEHVRMMHHIFCYQASPAKKQFSKDSDHSNHSSNGSSPLAPRTPSIVDFHHNNADYSIQVQVLGTEETWHTPSVLLARVKSSKGKAVFSQVHLEIDPTQYENDEDKYAALKDSNEARIEIFKDILQNRLNIDCRTCNNIKYTPGYLLGRYETKLNMISECDTIVDNVLDCDKIKLIFHTSVKKSPMEVASDSKLPIFVHICPPNFNTVDYFETLKTSHIGRLVIYSDILASTHRLLDKTLKHGVVVITKQQIDGVGRANNSWLSPPGGAPFSLQMHIPLKSKLGMRLSLTQHLVMVAVVSALKSLKGYDSLNIGIKWPNDLCLDSGEKLGGVVVNSTVNCDVAIINIGCGVNLNNDHPTVSINGLLRKKIKGDGSNFKAVGLEKYCASVFNQIENLYNTIQSKGFKEFYDLYYKFWLHSNAEVSIARNGESIKSKVVGIDDFGYLLVRLESGEEVNVQPDGNSFDMMQGLIAPKVF